MSEIRRDPLGNGWVIFSNKRINRPNDYQKKGVKCPFCHGHEQDTPPAILSWPSKNNWQIRLVPNKYPALTLSKQFIKPIKGFYECAGGYGLHDVLIETPSHNLSIEKFSIGRIGKIFEICADRCAQMKMEKNIKYAMVFKNMGRNAGASLRHPHSQIIALPLVPATVENELKKIAAFYKRTGKCLFCEILKNEVKLRKRLIYENDLYAAFCPFASRFFFEVWILPKKHEPEFESPKNDFYSLAMAVKEVFLKLKKSIKDLSYNMIVHSCPRGVYKHYHWHIEILPKLANIAGFEWGSGFHINSIKPEYAADILRRGKKFNFGREER